MMKRLRLIFSGLTMALLLAISFAPVASFADTKSDCKSNGGVYVSAALGKGNQCFGSNDINPIFDLIAYIITFAVGVIGLIMVLMIVIAGLQYVLSGTSPDAAKDAKDRIKNVFTGFVMLIFMWAALQVILPTGISVFKS